MSVKYCTSNTCGAKVEYSALTPPSKCPRCGTSLTIAFKTTTPPSLSAVATALGQTFTFEQVQAMLAQTQGKPTSPVRRSIPPRKRSADTYAPGHGSNTSNSISVDADLGTPPPDVDDGEEGSDEFDTYEVQANARLLKEQADMQEIARAFVAPLPSANKVVKFEDAVQIVEDTTPAPKKPRRRKG